MGENYDGIRELFQKGDTDIVIDGSKKQAVLEQAELFSAMQENHASVSGNKWQLLKSQVYYMDKTILTVHLMACLATVLLGGWKYWSEVSMIVSGVLGALSLMEVGGMFCARMTELEETCYFNVKQLVVFHMAFSGIISLTALFAAFLSAGLRQGSGIVKTGLYTLVPFVFTECLCMTILLMGIGRKNLLILVAAGIFSVFFWGVLSSIPGVYEVSAMAFWGMALAAGSGILAIQTKRFFDALDKGEILCAD